MSLVQEGEINWSKVKVIGTMIDKNIPQAILDRLNSLDDLQIGYLIWQMLEDKVKHVGLKGTINYIEANLVTQREEKGRE